MKKDFKQCDKVCNIETRDNSWILIKNNTNSSVLDQVRNIVGTRSIFQAEDHFRTAIRDQIHEDFKKLKIVM